MRVAILSSGRFHALDLARELDACGHDVAFYSLVPPWRTRLHGLPAHANHWLGPLVGPAWVAARALAGTSLGQHASRATVELLDQVAAHVVGRCDAFIGMSGMSLHTLASVRRRFGATTFLERGSMHIRAQKDILDARPGARGAAVADWMVAREEAEYRAADFISIPSAHVARSFAAEGVPTDRVMVNPYGVSLNEFPPTPTPPGPPRILMTGAWSWQKGADVLARAFAELTETMPEVELHHVGPRGDLPLPTMPRFYHHEPVPQHALSAHYARAHVFALASRQDGFGLVLSQALASGVPIVCSERTAGFDLRAFAADDCVTLVPPDDAPALAHALSAALARRGASGAPRTALTDAGRQALTWRAYGRRWDANLRARAGP